MFCCGFMYWTSWHLYWMFLWLNRNDRIACDRTHNNHLTHNATWPIISHPQTSKCTSSSTANQKFILDRNSPHIITNTSHQRVNKKRITTGIDQFCILRSCAQVKRNEKWVSNGPSNALKSEEKKSRQYKELGIHFELRYVQFTKHVSRSRV